MSTEQLQLRLREALELENIEDIKEWLDKGANPNLELRLPGAVVEMPMITAARINFIAGLDILHQAGGLIDGKASSGMTPISAAANHGRVDAGRWLLHHGADALHMDSTRECALLKALAQQRIDFANMLLQEEPRCRGDYLVDVARKIIFQRDLSTCQWLLEQGVPPNLTDRLGNPWLYLIQSGRATLTEPLANLLLNAGADVNLANNGGDTPLHQALKLKVVSSIVQLLRAGADPDLPNKAGHTVRAKLQKLDEADEVRTAFVAWEASQAAHRVIQEAPAELRPLA